MLEFFTQKSQAEANRGALEELLRDRPLTTTQMAGRARPRKPQAEVKQWEVYRS